MPIVLDGNSLTIEQLVKIARNGEKVELHPDALKRIKICRDMLEEKIVAHEIMYGVNTGIGEFSEVVLNSASVPVIITDSTRKTVIAYGNITDKKMTDSDLKKLF